MDDKTRGLSNDDITGRSEEDVRNYADTRPARPSTDRSRSEEETTRRTREIRAEIEQTRDDMSETIDAIQEKLRPGNIVSEATDRVKHATTERVRQMADTASENAQYAVERTREMAGTAMEGVRREAIPAILIGVGVAWLLMDRYNSRKRESYEYYGGDEYRTGGPSSYGSEYTEYGTESPGYAVGRSGSYSRESSMSRAGESAMRGARRAGNQFQRLLQRNPLMVGAAALAVGAAVGLALPETERERELLGEAADTVVNRAQDIARNAATQVRQAAGEVASEVTNQVIGGKEK